LRAFCPRVTRFRESYFVVIKQHPPRWFDNAVAGRRLIKAVVQRFSDLILLDFPQRIVAFAVEPSRASMSLKMLRGVLRYGHAVLAWGDVAILVHRNIDLRPDAEAPRR
jgi:hypothetical protein